MRTYLALCGVYMHACSKITHTFTCIQMSHNMHAYIFPCIIEPQAHIMRAHAQLAIFFFSADTLLVCQMRAALCTETDIIVNIVGGSDSGRCRNSHCLPRATSGDPSQHAFTHTTSHRSDEGTTVEFVRYVCLLIINCHSALIMMM